MYRKNKVMSIQDERESKEKWKTTDIEKVKQNTDC